jgi:ketosteroid isomerase-like protein
MSDPIAPSVARHPAEAVEFVALAVSDGDLEAAVAQYERTCVLQPWATADTDDGRSPAHWLGQVMDLRLPVSLRICAVIPAGGVALVLGQRQITGTGPDCEPVDLSGLGAAVVCRQLGGGWRIAADAWQLTGSGGGAPE